MNKVSYKMENDNVSAGAAIGGIGAGSAAVRYAYKLNPNFKSQRALGRSISGAIGGSLGSGVGSYAVLKALRTDPDNLKRGVAMHSFIGGSKGMFDGIESANRTNKILRSRRNKALALAAILGLVYKNEKSASDKDKTISRWENAKIQAAGGTATGAVIGGLLGAGAGHMVAKDIGGGALGRAHMSVKQRLGLGALGVAGGAIYGGLNGGIASGISGGIVGSGVKDNASDAEYAVDQAKRKGLAGAGLGALLGLAINKNPIILATAGGASGALGGLANSMPGRKILRKIEDK